jgi:outer membrane autotransporter protein
LRTELNQGGDPANQHTDRLLISGDVIGQTVLEVNGTGSGANTNVAGNQKPAADEGISLVQVAGAATGDAFKLDHGYVTSQGGPFQYRLFAYGPGSANGPASQNLMDGGQTVQWDYRLQTACTDSLGNVQAGTCDSGNAGDGGGSSGGDGRPALAPQGSTYLVAPLALLNYQGVVMDSLVRRLGDVRRNRPQQPGDTADVFMRALTSHSTYSSNLGFHDYGYNFSQNINALQAGADFLRLRRDGGDLRLGAAVTVGSTSIDPDASSIEQSSARVDTQGIAFTGTWESRSGWYVDGVLSAGHFAGDVTAQGRNAGRVVANGFGVSLEAGRTIVLSNGLEIEPMAQLLGQALRFKNRQDSDGIVAQPGDVRALTGRLGVRFTMPVPSTDSWAPYLRIQLQHTWMDSQDANLSGTTFKVGAPGSAIQFGIGATGMVTARLSVYGEVSGQRRLGNGFNDLTATGGIRYQF